MSSVKKRPNGSWRARYRDDAGKEHARHFPTRTAAQHWLDSITASRVTGTYVDPVDAKTPLSAYYSTWSERQVWAHGTELAMSLAIRSCTFADEPVGRITRSHVEYWVKSMVADGLASSTIKTRLNNVRAVLRAAARDRLIPRDPSDGVPAPRQRRNAAAMTIPTPTEVQSLLDAADGQWHVYLAVAAFTGLRLGELSGLQVDDIDFPRRLLHVSRQVQRGQGGRLLVTPPKYGSERTVYLADELVALLSAHVAEMPASAEPWLFSAPNGGPPHRATVNYTWHATARRAKVADHTLHSLRHFYASGLIAAGCDVVTVQRALGHANATTTLSTYSHLWPNAEDRTRAAASGLIRAARGLSADSTGAVRPSAQ